MTYQSNSHDCAGDLFHETYFKQCQCSWAMIPISFTKWKSMNLTTCQYSRDNVPDQFCLYPSFEKVNDFYSNCTDRNMCKYFEYVTKISKRHLIKEEFRNWSSLLKDFPQLKKTILTGNDSSIPESITQHFAKVRNN